MHRSASLIVFIFAASSFIGADLLGCGIPHDPPTQGTSGQTSSGTSGGSIGGSSGGTTGSSAACATLGESGCLGRADCHAVYVDSPRGKVFDHCADAVCPAVSCPEPVQGMICSAIVGPDGCPTCDCEPAGCQNDDDCPAGQLCAFPDDGPAGRSSQGACVPAPSACASDADCAPDQFCQPTESCDGTGCAFVSGTCQPRIICPQTACAPAPGSSCTVTIGADGCPTCECQVAICQVDSDCGAGQVCAFPVYGPTGGATPGPGQCVPAPVICPQVACAPAPGSSCTVTIGADGCPTCECQGTSCQVDADCGAGQRCQPDACPAGLPTCDQIPPGTQPPCCAPAGQCVPAPTSCWSDLGCPAGTTCQTDPDSPCNQPGSACFAPALICLPAPGCTADSDCASGETCQADPTDLCNQPDVACPMYLAARLICQPAPNCGALTCRDGELCQRVTSPDGTSIDGYACVPPTP